MQKAGLLDVEQWDAVNQLETHQTQHLRGPISAAIQDASISAGLCIDMHTSEILNIYCAV